MTKRLALAALACIALAGCSSTRSIGAEDKGRTIEIKEGHVLSLTLAENPTTGFQWSLQPHDNLVLKPHGSSEFVPDSHGRVGAGGERTWRFLGAKPGRAAIKLDYCRPWEKDIPPAETYSINIVVKARQ